MICPSSKELLERFMTKWVYSFGAEKTEGRGEMKNLLGGKGANLAEMASLGLPVPPGFTITTEVCTYFYENDKTYPPELAAEVDAAVSAIGAKRSGLFGDDSTRCWFRCAPEHALRCPA